MLEFKKGVDILAFTGGVRTIEEANTIIELKLDAGNREKLAPIKNEEALLKIANAIALCEPDEVFIDTGSEADTQWVREYSLRKGEEKKLAKEGHTIHFDPFADRPPPGTIMCTCGWWVMAEPHVCKTEVMPMRAPRCFGSAAMVSVVSALALMRRS